MSYQVLARKWRPQRFSELVGQEHVVNAISNALDNNRLHHAYLFTGTRGVGKTTIARIFAKSLNCETGQSANPCGKCQTCIDIEQGRYVDLLEIDAASRTKVEDTRELLDNVQYRPTRGDFKVYLIDEVHMLSKHSFNALLKTLEEPPPHVKFLLATTDPQKLPITILSRCLQFNLKALSREQIAKQLAHVLTHENLEYDNAALALIARSAQGSMRDALSLTDQAIAQGNNTVMKETVTSMLGLLDKNHIYKILLALIGNENQRVLALVDEIAEQAPDFVQVLHELNATLHQIALTQIVPDACKLETTHARVIYQLAQSFSPEQVQLLYQIGLDGIKTLPFAPDPRTGIEMTLMRMLAFTPTTLVQSPESVIKHTTPAPNPAKVTSESPSKVELAVTTPRDFIVNDQTDLKPSNPAETNTNKPDIIQSLTNAPLIDESLANEVKTGERDTDQEDIDHINSLMEEQRELEQQASDMREDGPSVATNNSHGNEKVQIEASTEQLSQSDAANAAHNDNVSSDNDELARTKAMLALQQRMKQAAIEASDDGKKPNLDVPVQSPKAVSEDVIDARPQISTSASLFTSEAQEILKSTSFSEDDESPPWEMDQPFAVEDADSTPIDISQSTDSDTRDLGAILPKTEDASPAVMPVQSTYDSEDKLSSTPETVAVKSAGLEQNSDENLSQQALTPYLESGDKLTHASQIDAWSALVEKLNVGGLIKQTALHSTYAKNDNSVTMTLHHAQQHLLSDSAHQQLQTALSDVLQQPIQLTIDMGEPNNTPFALQQRIQDMRLAHAKHIVESDESIQNLTQSFSATVISDSIKPR